MERIKRNERLGALARILVESPNRAFTLSDFGERFGAAKSTLSEDIDILSGVFEQYGLGRLNTVSGAGGGVRYCPLLTKEQIASGLSALAQRLSQPGRLLPGGFLYTSDVICDPEAADFMAGVLARDYYDQPIDFVLTMETKGIPVAMTTARKLHVPLVIARRDARAYEGSAVKISYTAGSNSDRMETMALSRRSVKSGQRALIIDDFMKGGGTVLGMQNLMTEFNVQVAGIGVVIATALPEHKAVDGVHVLMTLRERDGDHVHVEPTAWAIQGSATGEEKE